MCIEKEPVECIFPNGAFLSHFFPIKLKDDALQVQPFVLITLIDVGRPRPL